MAYRNTDRPLTVRVPRPAAPAALVAAVLGCTKASIALLVIGVLVGLPIAVAEELGAPVGVLSWLPAIGIGGGLGLLLPAVATAKVTLLILSWRTDRLVKATRQLLEPRS